MRSWLPILVMRGSSLVSAAFATIAVPPVGSLVEARSDRSPRGARVPFTIGRLAVGPPAVHGPWRPGLWHVLSQSSENFRGQMPGLPTSERGQFEGSKGRSPRDSRLVQTSCMRSPQLISSYRAGRRLNVCSRTLRRYVRRGILKGLFERGQWRYDSADVEFLRRHGPPHQCGKAAARLLGIGVRRLRELTRQGIVPAQKAKSGHIYARDELLSLRDDIGRYRGRVRALKTHSVPKIRSYSRSWLSDDAIEP